MAFYSGTQINAAGSLITILDTELVKNANWSIYDAAVGANNKTYKCATAGAEFYLNVADNQLGYATVSIWEGWNAVGHVGTGLNSAAYYTIYWRKTGTALSPAAYYIHLSDERVIYSCFGTNLNYSHFAGNVERYNAAYNIPILVGVRNTINTIINPLGNGGPVVSSFGWIALAIYRATVFECCATYYDYSTPAGNGYIPGKEKNIGWFIRENIIGIPYLARNIGVMRGVQSMQAMTAGTTGIAHGDTITVGGDTWDVHGSGQLAVLKRA
jgi:hypothetical protein